MKKKLALSAASLLFTLLLAEAALRILGIAEAGRGSPWFAGGNHPRFLFQPDPLSGYTLRPGFRGREVAPGNEFDVPAVIDGRGRRDHRHTAPPQPSVLAVGDSMTFGEGVPADRAFAAILERETGVRVYNGGVPGHSSGQMAGRLRRLLPELKPAAVVMTLSPLWDRQRCAAPFLYKEGYIVAAGYADRLVLLDGNLYSKETRLRGIGSATAWAKHHSALARLALPALAGAARSLRKKPDDQRPVLADFEPTLRNILEARRLTQSFGGRFLVVFIDDRGTDFQRDRLVLQGRLQGLGVAYAAADEILPGASWSALRFPRDGHWNAAGHEAVGKALAPRVRTLIAAP
ncbi:MAG TPA: hypothetical protein VG477_14240 [Thermoanaerobaculia bacterium]|nr:hypothetical protein [Thermoanaerobaculia bacterium]